MRFVIVVVPGIATTLVDASGRPGTAESVVAETIITIVADPASPA